MQIAAAVTMVRDDPEFLDIWLRYYGGLFGRQALYVINHGQQDWIKEMAQGCNIIGIPGFAHKGFDAKRWRLLNHLVQGLRQYHKHVIVGDVDELVLRDPALGSLGDFLEETRKGTVITAFGLELVHRSYEEPAAFTAPILGGRRFVRVSPLYTKPCIVSAATQISRGGHYATAETLDMPEGLYLFHLKFADRGLYSRVLDRRNAVAEATGAERPRDAMIGRHWFAQTRDDSLQFAVIDDAPVSADFDFTAHRAAMASSWAPRGDDGYWQFDRHDDAQLYEVPERFWRMF
ncbi:MAG: glycosyltransferase family 2 protein [Mangrovicoccus sp.]